MAITKRVLIAILILIYVCVYKYDYISRLNHPSQRRSGYEQIKNKQNFRVSSNENMGKSPNGPPFGPFSREKIKIAHLLPKGSAC